MFNFLQKQNTRARNYPKYVFRYPTTCHVELILGISKGYTFPDGTLVGV